MDQLNTKLFQSGQLKKDGINKCIEYRMSNIFNMVWRWIGSAFKVHGSSAIVPTRDSESPYLKSRSNTTGGNWGGGGCAAKVSICTACNNKLKVISNEACFVKVWRYEALKFI